MPTVQVLCPCLVMGNLRAYIVMVAGAARVSGRCVGLGVPLLRRVREIVKVQRI